MSDLKNNCTNMYLKAKTYIYVFAKSTLCQLAKIPPQVGQKNAIVVSYITKRSRPVNMHQPKSFKISNIPTFVFYWRHEFLVTSIEILTRKV